MLSLVKLRANKSCAAPSLAVSVSELASTVGVEAEELRGPLEADLKKELSHTVLVEPGELTVPLERTNFLKVGWFLPHGRWWTVCLSFLMLQQPR